MVLQLEITEQMIKCFHLCAKRGDYKQLIDDYQRFINTVCDNLKLVKYFDQGDEIRTAPLPDGTSIPALAYAVSNNIEVFLKYLTARNPENPSQPGINAEELEKKFPKLVNNFKAALSAKNWDEFYEMYKNLGDHIIIVAREQNVIDFRIEHDRNGFETFAERDNYADCLQKTDPNAESMIQRKTISLPNWITNSGERVVKRATIEKATTPSHCTTPNQRPDHTNGYSEQSFSPVASIKQVDIDQLKNQLQIEISEMRNFFKQGLKELESKLECIQQKTDSHSDKDIQKKIKELEEEIKSKQTRSEASLQSEIFSLTESMIELREETDATYTGVEIALEKKIQEGLSKVEADLKASVNASEERMKLQLQSEMSNLRDWFRKQSADNKNEMKELLKKEIEQMKTKMDSDVEKNRKTTSEFVIACEAKMEEKLHEVLRNEVIIAENKLQEQISLKSRDLQNILTELEEIIANTKRVFDKENAKNDVKLKKQLEIQLRQISSDIENNAQSKIEMLAKEIEQRLSKLETQVCNEENFSKEKSPQNENSAETIFEKLQEAEHRIDSKLEEKLLELEQKLNLKEDRLDLKLEALMDVFIQNETRKIINDAPIPKVRTVTSDDFEMGCVYGKDRDASDEFDSDDERLEFSANCLPTPLLDDDDEIHEMKKDLERKLAEQNKLFEAEIQEKQEQRRQMNKNAEEERKQLSGFKRGGAGRWSCHQ